MIVKTVNVIEYKDDAVLAVHAFSDDEEGNKQAEDMFAAFMKERDGMTEEDIKVAMEEGWWEEGDYQIFLAHSS